MCATAPRILSILHLTEEFWDLTIDKVLCLDPAVCTLVSIQLNLVAGTLGMFIWERPDLEVLVKKLLRFDVL